MAFEEVIPRVTSHSSRWRGKGDTIALTIGDADFRMPPAIQTILQQRLDHGVLGYDTMPDQVINSFLKRLSSRYHWEVSPDSLVLLPGVVQGLNLACRAFVKPGEAMVTETPVYYPFLEAGANSGRRLIELPALFNDTNGDGRWCFNIQRFATLAKDPDTRLLLLCNPQNPLGRVLTEDELLQIGQICLREKLIICADEIHCDLLFDQQRHQPIAAISDQLARITVTLMSPSKAFAMSGLGGAFAIITDPELRQKFESAGAGLIPNINVMALAAMQAAYDDCDDWLQTEVAYLQASRDCLVDGLQSLENVALTVPQATYFLWLDFRRCGFADPYEAIRQCGVELSDGKIFGGEGFLRMNFASPRARLKQALARLQGKLSA